jgi:hypothetical protein
MLLALRHLLEQDATLPQRTNWPVNMIITFMEEVLRLAHFKWQGAFYAQIDGCAMGCPTSTPLLNAFMTRFELDALTRYRLLHDPPQTP